jgi:hypothetical protein
MSSEQQPRIESQLGVITAWATFGTIAVSQLMYLLLTIGLHVKPEHVDAVRHAGMISVAVAASSWYYVLLCDLVLVLPYVYVCRRDAKAKTYGPSDFRKIVVHINRQVVYAWTFLTGLMLLLLLPLSLWRLLVLISFLLILGPVLGSWLGYLSARYIVKLERFEYADVLWMRRPFGAAGVVGMVSDAQTNWVAERLGRIRGAPETGSAKLVVFQHHPYESLPGTSQAQYEGLVRRLGKDGLLAIVSAHTHASEYRDQTYVAGHPIPQFIVGSTTDPPQEAALLSVRYRHGSTTVDFRTIPLVERAHPRNEVQDLAQRPRECATTAAQPGGGPAEKTAEPSAADSPASGNPEDLFAPVPFCRCQHAMAEILHRPACQDLKVPRGNDREGQKQRAHALLSCVGDPEGAARPDALSDDNPYRWLGLNCDGYKDGKATNQEGAARCVDRSKNEKLDELVCLGWAASIFQGRRYQGWNLEASLRLGWEPLSTFASWEHSEDTGGRPD